MSENFQEILLKEVNQLFQPLLLAAESEEARTKLFGSLGWDLQAITGFPINDFQNCLDELSTAYIQIQSWIDTPPSTFDQLLNALSTVQRVVQSIEKLHQVLDKPGLRKPEGFEKLAEDLIELLTVNYLADRHSQSYALASLLTMIEEDDVAPSELVIDPETNFVIRLPTPRPKLHFDRISKLLQDPVAVLKSEYMPHGLATYTDAQAAADRLFPRLATLLATCGIRSIYGLNPAYGISLGRGGDEIAQLSLGIMIPLEPDPTLVDSEFGAILAFSPADRGDLGLVISPFGRLSITQTLESWMVNLRLVGGQEGFSVHPKHGIRFSDISHKANIGFSVKLTKLINETGAAFMFGSTKETRLEVGQFAISWEANLGANKQDYSLLIETSSSTFVVSAGDGDGFLQQILPKDGLRVDFDLALGWSNTRGFFFRGGAGLEATLPIHKDLLGVLIVDSVYLSLQAKETNIDLVVAATATVKLGPVTAVIEQMGLIASLTFPKKGGNLGPVNLELGFSTKGAGLSIDASVVVGSGYLSFDKDKQLYYGFVHLEIAETLNLTAVGIITTKMPDGSPGFSMLVLIAVQFSPPFQLGYGFTLNGLGGLLGINRTAAVDALRLGLRSGTLGSILFPVDPVHNAARIVSDLGSVFPTAEGRFIFGPMAILGWGPKTLIMLELGLILELPEPVRLIILGRLRVLLPEEKNPVVRIQLDSLGMIDFGSGDVSIDAVLYDSEIKGFNITGDMALRANFGAKPGFLLSVGGFHPAFQAPAGFPTLARVAISLATGDNPRLRLSAYMAVTTNTVQFGALLELYARLGDFSVEGRLGFDALIQFEPFGFVADLGAMVAIKFGKQVLLCLMLELTLSGPTPWHAWGKASFKFLFWTVTVHVSVKAGEAQSPSLPAPVQLRPLLLAALKEQCNWATQLPLGEHPIVVLKEQPEGTEMLVHPLAVLQVSQKVVPLELDLTRFGNAAPEGERNFKLGVDGADKTEYVYDLFAPAQFREMSDDEKLSAKAFESLKSGLRFSVGGYECGKPVIENDMKYEGPDLLHRSVAGISQITGSGATPKPYVLTTDFLERVAPSGAAGLTALKQTGKAKYRVAPSEGVPTTGFILKPRRYVVVGDGGAIDIRESYAEATEAMQKRTLSTAGQERLRVVPYIGGDAA